jgi:hypothetical protein
MRNALLLQRLFGADSLRSDNSGGSCPAAALRRHENTASTLEHNFP